LSLPGPVAGLTDRRGAIIAGRAILGGVPGLLALVIATFVPGQAAAEVFAISQFEGAYAMGPAFFWTPPGGLAGMVAGAVWAARRPPQ